LPAPNEVIKSKFITNIFQKYVRDVDIRSFKKKFSYYLIFRICRKFLVQDIVLQIYNFKIFGSIKKNKTSYFLLKKCEFGDYHELDTIEKISNKNKILFIDCGCNYGFYSFYSASLSNKNLVYSIEASKKTHTEFLRNLKLNKFSNIRFENKAISNFDNEIINFHESENDWESSQSHYDFNLNSTYKVNTLTIDTLVKKINFEDFRIIIKLDIEGAEIKALEGAFNLIKKTSPLIIMEFSKYIFNDHSKVTFFKNFLNKFDYSIYDTNCDKITLDEVIIKLDKLGKRHKTIGNLYLIKNSSNVLGVFLQNE
tara:strand:+ start:559 stop:1491 length:933 start_codon:yes stop_codon:yes gene_type:complete